MTLYCPTCSQPTSGRQPAFSKEQRRFPDGDPVFITTNWNCVNYIKRCGGICLLCNYPPESYDLSLCESKDTWVLTYKEKDSEAPRKLAFAALQHKASQARIIPIEPTYLETSYER